MISSDTVEIAVEAPLLTSLSYKLPDNLKDKVQLGSRVEVPLGRRKSRGVVVGENVSDKKSAYTLKEISSLLDEPCIGEKTRLWLKWLAQYYLHPPGQVFSMAFAPAKEGRKRKSKKTSPTVFAEDSTTSKTPLAPTPDQHAAIEAIHKSIDSNQFHSFLLFGVTGSGKTEVYLQAIQKVLDQKKQALVLVPEISLTPQLTKRFVERFGDDVAIIHSHLTDRERTDQWWAAVRGQKNILVGARSALFCPLENLGLIVVDEEHEASFKQEEQLKYNARDAAIMRARFSNCPVVLGSATPSLESWANAESNKHTLLSLTSRVENRPLPEIHIVDLRMTKENRAKPDGEKNLPYWLSPELCDELDFVLKAKEQAALFLNRRGFAQFVICPGCGATENCPNCSVTLTAHQRGHQLSCHYCGFEKPFVKRCSTCHQEDLKPLGLGTEKVSEDLQGLFPEARILRADRDEINSREDLEQLIEKIHKNEVDIIVGTQMIAKGHDFPNLTLVGAVLADMSLNFPDFRSSERTFQLLTQVAGRAGRHQKPGRVVIQTFMPTHPAVTYAQKHDFVNFAKEEIQARKELHYPPFGKLACIRIQGINLDRVELAASKAREFCESLTKLKPEFSHVEILGPCESAIARIKNKHRFQLLLKHTSSKDLNSFLQHFLSQTDYLPTGVRVSVDVDPLNIF